MCLCLLHLHTPHLPLILEALEALMWRFAPLCGPDGTSDAVPIIGENAGLIYVQDAERIEITVSQLRTPNHLPAASVTMESGHRGRLGNGPVGF